MIRLFSVHAFLSEEYIEKQSKFVPINDHGQV